MDELRRGFHQQLDDARNELAQLMAMVIERISRATAIVLNLDLEGASQLIEDDDEMDARSITLEDKCYQMLALQAPVAGDLRQVVGIVKMAGEVERSADLTVNIAKVARRVYGHELDPRVRGLIARMGEQAAQLFTAALESFKENDDAKAAAIDDMDSYLDGLQREVVRTILEQHAGADLDLQVAIQTAMLARFYERIGDHAVNIGERVRFLVTGWLPEHHGSERFRRKEDTGEIPRTPGS